MLSLVGGVIILYYAMRCITRAYFTDLIKCQKLSGTREEHLAIASSLFLALIVRLPILPLCLLKATTNVLILSPVPRYGSLAVLIDEHILWASRSAAVPE